jgi:potassium efflux system protein
MKELLLEILGWLGYLERPSVLLQLLVSLAALTLCRLARQRRWRKRWQARLPARVVPHLGQLLIGLGCLVLAAWGQPFGLAALLGVLWLGWSGLSWLRLLLLRWLPESEIHRLDTRLLRPIFLVVTALLLISEVDSLRNLGVIPLGQLLGVTVSTEKVFHALLVIYIVLVGCGPPAAGLAWLLQRALAMSHGSRKATELMLRYTVVGLGLVSVAVNLGLNTTALIAVAGGLSVGLGFGIKEVFSNFVSGLWLLFEGSVRPGEVLILDGDACEVRRLGLRATLLWRGRDNAELLIPNQAFFTQATTTYTGSDRMRRSQVNVAAAYRHDPAAVIALLEATALQVPGVLSTPAPKALLLNYGDSAINYILRFWITNPMDHPALCSDVSRAIWQAFREHAIEIPFPQQVQYQLDGALQEP